MGDEWSYVGTLRNEKKFNLNNNVFFVINGNDIARGKIVGIELPPDENPEYIYKIRVPEQLVIHTGQEYKKMVCDKIFNTLAEAKDSAIRQLENRYELQKKEINNYFKQWQDT